MTAARAMPESTESENFPALRDFSRRRPTPGVEPVRRFVITT